MPTQLDRDIFDVITYLVSSAPTSIQETPSLAAFRMLDAAQRLMTLVEQSDAFEPDEFLRSAQSEYLENFNFVMTDQERFNTWLATYVQSFAREALHRARGTS